MLKRFYADNFRCLTNFELKLDESNVFLGANGTGKTIRVDRSSGRFRISWHAAVGSMKYSRHVTLP